MIALARRCTIPVGTLALALTVAAAPAPAAERPPFEAEAVRDAVTLRAGSRPSYYKVGTLSKGERVTVQEIYFGWYKIKPPEGVHSYVSRGYVDAKNDGSVGIVNSEDVDVTAANIKGPSLSYADQLVLDQGTKVRIVGRESSFYKIKPPEGAFVFAPPDSLRRVGADTAGATAERADSGSQAGGARPGDEGGPGSASAGGGQSEPESGGDAGADSGEASVSSGSEAASASGAGSNATSADERGGDENQTSGNVQLASAGSAGISGEAASDESEPGDRDATSDAGKADGSDSENAGTGEAGEADASGSRDQASGGSDAGSDGTASEPSGASAADDTSNSSQGDGSSSSKDQSGSDAAEPADLKATKGMSVETRAQSEALRQLEKKMLPRFNEPLSKQPIETMIGEYQAIKKTDLPAYDRRIVEIRLQALKRNRELARTLDKIDTLEQASAEQDKQDKQDEQRREQAADTLPRHQYDAVGKLVASGVYDGENLPRLFRLIEPASGYTIGYVEPDETRPNAMLGRVVGIVGTKSRDRSLDLRIFDIERVDLLGNGESG